MEKEAKLLKGNEALAIGAIRAGADGYFGYPITCLLYTSILFLPLYYRRIQSTILLHNACIIGTSRVRLFIKGLVGLHNNLSIK